jgi:hypothetical protein
MVAYHHHCPEKLTKEYMAIVLLCESKLIVFRVT